MGTFIVLMLFLHCFVSALSASSSFVHCSRGHWHLRLYLESLGGKKRTRIWYNTSSLPAPLNQSALVPSNRSGSSKGSTCLGTLNPNPLSYMLFSTTLVKDSARSVCKKKPCFLFLLVSNRSSLKAVSKILKALSPKSHAGMICAWWHKQQEDAAVTEIRVPAFFSWLYIKFYIKILIFLHPQLKHHQLVYHCTWHSQ